MKKAFLFLVSLVLLLGMVSFTASAEVEYKTTLTVEVFDRGNMPAEYGTVDNNRWTRWIQENFGDPNGIKVVFYPVPRSDEVTKLNTLMASGDAPNIVFGYNAAQMQNFALLGGLYDLTDLIEEYGDNIKVHHDLSYGKINGRQYAVYGRRQTLDMTANYIRKDWLDKLGYELQVNEDGFYHMSVEDLTSILAQFKEKDLDNTGLEIFPLGMTGAQNLSRSTRGIFEYFYNRAAIDEYTLATVPQFNWEGYYDGLVWMNDAYNKRWVDPDFIAETDSSYKLLDNYILTGRCGFWSHDSWHGVAKDGVLEQLYKANPSAEVVAVQIDNVHGEQMTQVYAPVDMIVYVPATSTEDQAIAAVKYMNFLADCNNHATLLYGFEGEHYQIVDGIPQYIDEDYVAATKISTNDLAFMYDGDYIYGEQMILAVLPECTRELRATTLKLGVVGAYHDFNFDRPIVSNTEYKSNLSSKMGELLAQCIMCKPTELKATFDAKVAEYMSIGGTEVMNEKIEVYNIMNP